MHHEHGIVPWREGKIYSPVVSESDGVVLPEIVADEVERFLLSSLAMCLSDSTRRRSVSAKPGFISISIRKSSPQTEHCRGSKVSFTMVEGSIARSDLLICF